MTPTDRALIGTTLVALERGRWAVYVVVVFRDRTVVRRITDYHRLRMAEFAARVIDTAINRS